MVRETKCGDAVLGRRIEDRARLERRRCTVTAGVAAACFAMTRGAVVAARDRTGARPRCSSVVIARSDAGPAPAPSPTGACRHRQRGCGSNHPIVRFVGRSRTAAADRDRVRRSPRRCRCRIRRHETPARDRLEVAELVRDVRDAVALEDRAAPAAGSSPSAARAAVMPCRRAGHRAAPAWRPLDGGRAACLPSQSPRSCSRNGSCVGTRPPLTAGRQSADRRARDSNRALR